MSKKHFIAIAATIREEREIAKNDGGPDAVFAIDKLAAKLCVDFKSFNANFDCARFLSACGVQS